MYIDYSKNYEIWKKQGPTTFFLKLSLVFLHAEKALPVFAKFREIP